MDAAVEELYLQVPNIPHASVPEGGEENNELIRSWGEPLVPEFPILPHWEIGTSLGFLQLERASRMTGAGFVLLAGEGARLERAFVRYGNKDAGIVCS